jgi:Zn-dependent alcohol dehydrogenase
VFEAVGAGRPYAETRPIRVENLELEGPGKGAILVRIEAAGYATPTFSVVNGNRPRPVPMLLGHEAAGIVEEPGEGVSDISVGQRVVMTFLPRCGQCAGCHSNGKTPCEQGSASKTEGTLLGGNRRLSREVGGTFDVHDRPPIGAGYPASVPGLRPGHPPKDPAGSGQWLAKEDDSDLSAMISSWQAR